MLLSEVMNKVEKAILKTLAFFDIFKRPLTLEELWRNLYKLKTGKLQVLLGLRSLQKKKIISEKNSYFYLKGSKKTLIFFESNKLIRTKNWQKVNWVIKILKFVPFVKNISIINSLAFGASHKNSDIDILLITQKNRLWTARALTILILELLGQNKNKWYQANKFCFGFAFDEEKLNLGDIRFKNDIYFTFWLATLWPILDRKIYKKFILKNSWIFENLPNWFPKDIKNQQEKRSVMEKILTGRFGERLEKILSYLQIKRIWSDRENHRLGASVVANDQMIKLHAYDKREFYKIRWQEKLKELNIGG